MTRLTQHTYQTKLYQYALWLSIFTVVYNLLEGLVSVYFGAQADALSLFGFGLDSFIEVISGLGILAMVIRIRQNSESPRGDFERTALQITGLSFYLFAVGLFLTALYNIISGHKPETGVSGIIISLISIAFMWALVLGKTRVGRALNSKPILADANCSVVCIYMSAVLLVSSTIYQLTGFGFVDSLGAVGLIYFSINEGREAFERSRAAGIGPKDD